MPQLQERWRQAAYGELLYRRENSDLAISFPPDVERGTAPLLASRFGTRAHPPPSECCGHPKGRAHPLHAL